VGRKSDLQVIRERLQTEYQKLEKRSPQDRALDGSRHLRPNPDRADLAQSYALQEQEKAIHMIDHNRLDQIRQALERLEAGTYGRCTSCGRPINLERLEILPSAELCISCQENQE
jgi:DnaK suppressor protein